MRHGADGLRGNSGGGSPKSARFRPHRAAPDGRTWPPVTSRSGRGPHGPGVPAARPSPENPVRPGARETDSRDDVPMAERRACPAADRLRFGKGNTMRGRRAKPWTDHSGRLVDPLPATDDRPPSPMESSVVLHPRDEALARNPRWRPVCGDWISPFDRSVAGRMTIWTRSRAPRQRGNRERISICTPKQDRTAVCGARDATHRIPPGRPPINDEMWSAPATTRPLPPGKNINGARPPCCSAESSRNDLRTGGLRGNPVPV